MATSSAKGDSYPVAVAELFTHICQIEAHDDGIAFDPATLSARLPPGASRRKGHRN
ncbi:MAG: hypothetical protein WDM84_05810 [Bauldia sp.]